MKYKLSFCEIEQLADNIFEVTINEGAILDEKCAEEGRLFWYELRTEPYCLLVNSTNQFSYSFTGAQKIGEHPLERKTAVLVDRSTLEKQMSTVIDIKELAGNAKNRKLFKDRDEAIKWLETP